MLRKLAIAIAASGAFISASAVHALGMGEIELESALNQPLDARIKLVKTSELENWEIKPALAAADEFEQAGVDRVFFLNNIKFEVERVGSDVFINLSTQQPVVEPFLNFLVQVDWPNGRLLREYTLLLDPPVFAEGEGVAMTQAPATQPESVFEDETPPVTQDSVFEEAPVAEPEPVAEQSVFEEEPVTEQSVTDDGMSEETMPVEMVQEDTQTDMMGGYEEATTQSQTYQVQKNDTLWEVAIQVRPDRSITPQQAMLAIQDLNPDAFIRGNINRLKNNQHLQIPDRSQMESRTVSEAVAEVAVQNQAFEERKAQIEATRMAASGETGELGDAELKLLADGAATTEMDRAAGGQVSSAAAGDQSMLDQDLSLALENLDKANRENDELRSRLEALEEQIGTLQRLITLKDEQMVALQTSLGQEPEALTSDTAMTDAMDSMDAAGKTEMSDSAMPSTEGDLNFADQQAADQMDSSTAVDDMAADDPVSTSMGAEKPVSDAADAKPVPEKPKYELPPVPQPVGPMDFVMKNLPIIGGAGIGLLLLLLGLRIVKNRREAAEDEYIADDYHAAHDPLTQDDPLAHLEGDMNQNLDDEFADLELGNEADTGLEGLEEPESFDEEPLESQEELPEALDHDIDHESSDVLGEAEIYMAYGRLDQARDLLETTLNSQPERTDVRLKLLELLSEQDDSAGFSEHYSQVVSQGDAAQQAEANRLRQALSNPEAVGDVLDSDLGGSVDLDMGLDSGLEPVSSSEHSAEADLDFDIDGLDLSAPELDESASLDLDASTDDSSLDFELNLDDGLDSGDEALDAPILSDGQESGSSENDLEFELDSGLDSGLGETDESLDALDIEFDASSDEADLALSSELDSLDDGITSADEFELPELGSEDIELSEAGGSLGEVDDLTLDAELPTLDDGDDLDLSAELDAEPEASDLDASSVDFDFTSSDMSDEQATDNTLDALDKLDSELDAAFESDFDFNVEEEGESKSAAKAVAAAPEVAAPNDDLNLDDLDDDLDFLSGTDESETKLDLARAYIDMDDQDGAREILQEVVEEGSDQQKQEANRLLAGLA